MQEPEPTDDIEGWAIEDFAESLSVHIDESDPWAYSPDDESVSSQLLLDVHPDITEDVDGDVTSTEQDGWDIEGLLEGNARYDEEALQDLEAIRQFDEPEPLEVFDPDSRESLYVPDFNGTSLSRDLKIDELVASINDASDAQRRQIAEMLTGLSVGRLRTWSAWMREKAWTGYSLLMFLDFRVNYWESSPQYWESAYWYTRHDGWLWGHSSHNTLSLDATYVIVNARIHMPPDQVIDDTWLSDWEDNAMWRFGFRSFAEFAVFRSELGDHENWRAQVPWNSEVDEPEAIDSIAQGDYWSRPPSWDDFRILHPNERTLWFAQQDWYDQSEWHDNLGWERVWISGTHPYLADESFDSMSGL